MEKCELKQIGMKTNMLQYQSLQYLPGTQDFMSLPMDRTRYWFPYASCLLGTCDPAGFLHGCRLWTVCWGSICQFLKDTISIIFYCFKGYHCTHYFNIYFWIFVKYILSLLDVPLNEKRDFRPVVPELLREEPGELQSADGSVPWPLPCPPDCGIWPVL